MMVASAHIQIRFEPPKVNRRFGLTNTPGIGAKVLSKPSDRIQETRQPSEHEDFSTFFKTHESYVRAVIFRTCGGSELDDLTQQTFVKIWKALPAFEARSKIKTWIYRIAVNVGIDHLRKRARRREDKTMNIDDVYDLSQAKDATDAKVRKQNIATAAMNQLGPKHRPVFVLYFLEEQALQDVADILEISLGTVKSRLHFIRKHLISYLESEGISL